MSSELSTGEKIEVHKEAALSLCWHDRDRNACGVRAGASLECHAIEALAKEHTRLKEENEKLIEVAVTLLMASDGQFTEAQARVLVSIAMSTKSENANG